MPALHDIPFKRDKKIFSLFASLIFVSHPLQTQAVTYIWQRSEVLSALFFMSSYYFWITARCKRKNKFYIFALGLFILGLMDKGTILSLPFIILLTDISFFRNAEQRKDLLKAIRPLFLFFILILVLMFLPYEKIQYAMKFYHLAFMKFFGMHLSWLYMLTQFRVIPQYIKLCFFPVGQNLDYYFPLAHTGWNISTVSSFLFVCFILYGACRLLIKKPLAAFGIFWFLICLLPTSFASREPLWEHRTYLSIAGFALLLVTLIFSFISDGKIRDRTIIAIIAIFSLLTIARNSLWRDPIALMEDTVKKSPLNARAHLGLGTLYSIKGDKRKAIEHLEKSIRLNPQYAKPYNNLGLIYQERGDYQKAIPLFSEAIAKGKNFNLPYINLAYIYISLRNFQEAERLLTQALKIRKTDEVYRGIATLHFAEGKLNSAKNFFKKSLTLNPTNKKAYFNLGDLYFMEGNFLLAIEMYQRALDIDPSFRDVYVNMGVVYYNQGDLENAKISFEKALVLRPNDRIYRNLANVYHALKDYEKARECYEKSRVLYSPYIRLH